MTWYYRINAPHDELEDDGTSHGLVPINEATEFVANSLACLWRENGDESYLHAIADVLSPDRTRDGWRDAASIPDLTAWKKNVDGKLWTITGEEVPA